MSKASEWAMKHSQLEAVVAARPETTVAAMMDSDSLSLRVVTGAAGVPFAEVSHSPYDPQTRQSLMTLSAERALTLARWIIDTFGDEPDAP